MDENYVHIRRTEKVSKPAYGNNNSGSEIHQNTENGSHQRIIDREDVSQQRTPAREPVNSAPATYKKRTLSKEGWIHLGIPGIGIILFLLVIIILIATAGGPKLKVTTLPVEKGPMEAVYSVKGYLNFESGAYYIDFIDNDYATHGITGTSDARITNPLDNSLIKCNVTKINSYPSDSSYYKTLVNILGPDVAAPVNEIPQPVAPEAEGSDAIEDNADGEATDFGDDNHWIVSISVPWILSEDFPIPSDTIIDVDVITSEKAAAISVPSTCVIDTDTGSYVLVLSGKKAKNVEVTKGIVSGGRTEIISSEITESTVIINSAADTALSSITNNTKVKITSSGK